MQQALRRSSLVPAGFVVESACYEAGKAIITVRASNGFGLCPSCGTVSKRVHSRYWRRATDLPLSGRIVQLVVIARRLVKENTLIGAISVYYQEVRPFTDKQIALLQNFAAQAVIAIENTRLLNELRQRTDDLTESLEQQTATSEVLKVISSSPGELQPVFQAMLENATRICEAKFGTLLLRDGDTFRGAAEVGTPPELAEFNSAGPFRAVPGSPLHRVMQTRRVLREQIVILHRRLLAIVRDDDVCRRLMTTPGVGPVVALTYRATVDVPARFRKSKAVGAVFGLTCSKYQSGEIDRSGRISRCGDEMMRVMLYEAAQSMLVRSTRWSWLKAWAMQIARRRGMKKAIVALARRLAVIMHRIWVDGTEFRWTREQAAAAA